MLQYIHVFNNVDDSMRWSHQNGQLVCTKGAIMDWNQRTKEYESTIGLSVELTVSFHKTWSQKTILFTYLLAYYYYLLLPNDFYKLLTDNQDRSLHVSIHIDINRKTIVDNVTNNNTTKPVFWSKLKSLNIIMTTFKADENLCPRLYQLVQAKNVTGLNYI